MRAILYILFFLNSFFVLGQKKDTAIRIYLEDAYTGKNIKDAKVTLEGFEIPEIVGGYDKKGKFYYFTEIPEGYNTVMAYHKKYNEKGFQNIKSLPKELRLKLYNKLNVIYAFQHVDKNDTNKLIKNEIAVYVEDPYKIGITSDSIKNYNVFKNYLFEQIEESGLDIEPINPYWEFELKYGKNNEFLSQKVPYPKEILINDGLKLGIDKIYPLKGGYSSLDALNNDKFVIENVKEIVFYFRKKDGTKFKRFNEPIFKILKNIKHISIYSVINNKVNFESINKKKYSPRYTKSIDKINNFKTVDSSKIFFYKRDPDFVQSKTGFFKFMYNKKNISQIELDILKREPTKYQTLVKHITDFKPFFIQTNDIINPENSFLIDKGIGLGILDQFDYSSNFSEKFKIEQIE